MEQINVIGNRVLDIAMTAAYWITLISGVGQIINSIAKKDAQAAIKNAMQYGTAYVSIYLLKWGLGLVREVFK